MHPAPSPQPPFVPGASYRIVVGSAEEAAALIRDRLGPEARVLSVRTVPPRGWRRWFGRTRLEVVARIEPPEASGEPGETASVRDGPGGPASDHGRFSHVDGRQAFDRLAQPRLPDLLRRSGFGDVLLARLSATPAWNDIDGRPLHQSIVHVADELRRHIGAVPPRPLPARAAFFGPAGTGRTTALCKWLTREVFFKGRTGRVVKVEFDRPNSAEQLVVYCEALGVPFEHHPVPLAVPAGRFLYLDMPAISIDRPTENAALAQFMDQEHIEGRVLVLNAAYDAATLRAAHAAGRELGATHIVFTHLDELTHWGKLWDYLLDGVPSPLFLATGPSLSGECETDVPGAILARTLPGA